MDGCSVCGLFFVKKIGKHCVLCTRYLDGAVPRMRGAPLFIILKIILGIYWAYIVDDLPQKVYTFSYQNKERLMYENIVSMRRKPDGYNCNA